MTQYTRHVGNDRPLVEMAHTIRRRVFIEEQGVDEDIEMDGKDETATHVVLTDDGAPVATARLRMVGETAAKIERVAVSPEFRGEGLGLEVMDVAESAARNRGATAAILHAQRRVESFYAAIGYETVGEPFEEAGIPHVEMRKALD